MCFAPIAATALHVDQAPKTVWDAWRTSDRKTDYPPGGAASWPGPAPGWTFKSQYAACNPDAAPGVPSMVDFHRDLAKRLPGRLLIFNGDADPCVSYEGTRRAVRKIGFRQKQGGGYRPWFFNGTAATPELLAVKDRLFGTSLSLQEEGPQLGGYVVDYEHGLSFATVHGSGHMVPQVLLPLPLPRKPRTACFDPTSHGRAPVLLGRRCRRGRERPSASSATSSPPRTERRSRRRFRPTRSVRRWPVANSAASLISGLARRCRPSTSGAELPIALCNLLSVKDSRSPCNWSGARGRRTRRCCESPMGAPTLLAAAAAGLGDGLLAFVRDGARATNRVRL